VFGVVGFRILNISELVENLSRLATLGTVSGFGVHYIFGLVKDLGGLATLFDWHILVITIGKGNVAHQRTAVIPTNVIGGWPVPRSVWNVSVPGEH
jgi:hypothetical protein